MAPDHPSTDMTATPALWTALDANEVQRARAILDARPEAVHERAPDAHAAPRASYGTNTPLTHIAVRPGRVEMMTMLIDCGADVNALGYNENKGIAPAIVLAAWEGDVDMLRVLLEAGADPNVAGSAENALYTAIEHTSADAPAPNKVSVLLDNGARHDIFTAAMVGDVEMARAHAAAYPPLLGRRSLKRNRTPLEEAAHYGQDDVATALIVAKGLVKVGVTDDDVELGGGDGVLLPAAAVYSLQGLQESLVLLFTLPGAGATAASDAGG